MTGSILAALIVLLGVPAHSAAQDSPLKAGRDVQPPKKVYAPAPVYPPMARAASLQGLTGNRRQPAVFRIYAISRLEAFPPKRQKAVVKKLQTLLKEPDDAVAKAAESALAKLSSSQR